MPPVLECEICYYEKQVGPKVPFHPLGGGTLAAAVVGVLETEEWGTRRLLGRQQL